MYARMPPLSTGMPMSVRVNDDDADHVNDDDADDSIFDDNLSEILGTSSRVAISLDLDLAFGAVDVNIDPACTSLLSPLPPSPLPSPLLLLLLLLGSPSEVQKFSLS